MKNILMVAFHYPPVKGSSGVHRTLSFTRYLPSHGFKPIVLTVSESTFLNIDTTLCDYIPKDVEVVRARAYDAGRDFSIKGYYPLIFSLPDKWQSWIISGVSKGLKTIRKYKCQIIWSTYPIASAHLIAFILHKITKLPWVADFRDSMTEENYPQSKAVWQCYHWIEKQTVKNATYSIFTAPSARQMYIDRYGENYSDRFSVIENGIDENIFNNLRRNRENRPVGDDMLRFVHSGLLYPQERNPIHFFRAIAGLKRDGEISSKLLKIILRASGNEENYQKNLDDLSIADIVTLADPITYSEALQEMMQADGLLLFQGASCNHQIPAKLYEYLYTGIPIIGLVDRSGDTSKLLMASGHKYTSNLDNSADVAECIRKAIFDLKNKKINSDKFITNQFDRKRRTHNLAGLLKTV